MFLKDLNIGPSVITQKFTRRVSILILPGLVLMVLAFYFPAGVQAADSAQECGQSEQEGVPANKLVSLEPERSFFLVTQGKGEGRRIEMTIRPLEDSKKRHILTFKDLYRLNITQESDGSVHGQCLELIEKNKRITFKPDLELIPPVLAVDQQIRATGKAAIYDMESGEQTNTGDYCYVIKELSRTTFDTPGGPIKGYLLEYAFEIDLPYSNILLDLENGWSENRQLVYWRTKTTVEKLGLFGKTTFRSLSLAKDQPE